MAQEVGVGYVSIVPSGKGFGRAVEDELDQGVQRGTKKGDRSVFASFAKWGKRATVAGAATIAAFSIKGGISRLMAIDDAEGKLRGLGFSAKEISVVMGNALAAVKGTAFGLGDAATAAASATAAGIKPGKQLTKYLKLIGDAATIGGASFTEMGGIINQVTTKGRAGMENLNRLTERGIPIMEWLAKEYGVSGEALSKMVSKGKVDAKTFRKVIEDNIGGAALESGNTVRGALANLGASLGRIGAGVLGGIFSKIGPSAQNLTAALAPLEKKAGELGETIGTWAKQNGPAIIDGIGGAARRVRPVLSQVVELTLAFGRAALKSAKWLKDHKAAAIALASAIGALIVVTKAHQAAMAVSAAGGMIAWIKNIRIIAAVTRTWTAVQWALNIAMRANPIALVVTAIAALVGGLILAYKHSEAFRNIVNAVFNWIKTFVPAAISFVIDFVKNHWGLLVSILGGPIGAAVVLIIKNFDKIKAGVRVLVGAVVAGAVAIGNGFKAVWTGASKWVGKAWEYIRSLPGRIKGVFSGIWSGLAGGLKSAINSVLHLPIRIPKINTHIPGVGTVGGQTLIPRLASGGIVESATLAWVGEGREPEAVTPLSALDDKIYAAVSRAIRTDDRPNNEVRVLDLSESSLQRLAALVVSAVFAGANGVADQRQYDSLVKSRMPGAFAGGAV